METTEPMLSAQHTPDLVLGEEAKYYLHNIGRWAGFFSVLGYVFTAFIVLLVIFIGAFTSIISAFQSKYSGVDNDMATTAMSGALNFLRFIYFGLAVLNFFGAFYLGKFAARIKRGVATNDTPTATSAFESLKSFFKLIGITTIVVLSLDILFLIIFVIAAIGAASMR
jgi:hypothetical protein